MAHKQLVIALGLIVAGSPVAAQPDSGPIEMARTPPAEPAPPGGPDTRYCMRVDVTGNVIERIQCWTRAEWVEQGVDVDKWWATEGVRVIG